MNSQLQRYIDGAMSYNEACTIFILVCKNKILATNLMKRDTVSNREKLRYEIDKLLSDQPTYIKLEQDIQPVQRNHYPEPTEREMIIQPVISVSTFPTNKTTSVRERVLSERKELYLQRGHLHGRLHECASDDERLTIAKEIMSIQPKIDDFNRDLRLIEAGDIPKKYLTTKATAEEYMKVRNLKMYIARNQKKLEKASPTEKTRLEALILKHQTELDNL